MLHHPRMLWNCYHFTTTLPASQMSRLQSVLRAAARLVLQLPGRAPVSSAMRNLLHWLNFPQWVTYKLYLLTYKCLHRLAPDYLTVSVCALQWSMVVLGCNHLMTINCSSHRHVQLLLVRAPSTPLDQHPGTLYQLRFMIQQSHWEPLGRCWNCFCSDWQMCIGHGIRVTAHAFVAFIKGRLKCLLLLLLLLFF